MTVPKVASAIVRFARAEGAAIMGGAAQVAGYIIKNRVLIGRYTLTKDDMVKRKRKV